MKKAKIRKVKRSTDKKSDSSLQSSTQSFEVTLRQESIEPDEKLEPRNQETSDPQEILPFTQPSNPQTTPPVKQAPFTQPSNPQRIPPVQQAPLFAPLNNTQQDPPFTPPNQIPSETPIQQPLSFNSASRDPRPQTEGKFNKEYLLKELKEIASSVSSIDSKPSIKTHQPQVESTCYKCQCEVNEFPGQKCKHLCRECTADFIRKNQNNCGMCQTEFDTNFFIHETQYCIGCEQQVYIIGDYLAKACENHELCYLCLLKALDSKTCACKTSLSESQLAHIKTVLFGECGICKREFRNNYLLVNSCCELQVCGICQYRSNQRKCKCGKLLDSRGIDLMETIKMILIT